MKLNKIILPLLLCFIGINLSGQENTFDESGKWTDNDIVNVNLSIVFEDDLLIARRNDVLVNGEFMFNDSTEFYYDENDNLDFLTQLAWDGYTWVNSFRTIYDQDENHNRTLFQRQIWESTEWVNVNQIIYEFSNTNNRTLLKRQVWIDGVWLDSNQAIYYYNSDDLLSGFLAQDFVNGEWVDDTEDFISYDSEGLRIEKTQDRWTGSEWEKRYKTDYLHDGNGNRIENNRRVWVNSEWVANIKDIIGWDSQGNQILYILQSGNIDGEYENILQREYIFDINNVLIRDFYVRWIDEEWVNDNSRDYFYDDRENNTYVLTQDWVASTWVDEYQSFLYYQFPSKVNDDSSYNLIFNVFPNPSNGNFEIEFSNVASDKVQITVYSLQGKKLDQLSLNQSFGKSNIDLSHLENGSYLLTTNSKEGNRIMKIYVQK